MKNDEGILTSIVTSQHMFQATRLYYVMYAASAKLISRCRHRR